MDMYDEPTEKRIRGDQNMPPASPPPASSNAYDDLTMQMTRPTTPVTDAPAYNNAYENSTMQMAQPAAPAFMSALADQPTVTQKNVARRRFMGKSLVGLIAAGGAAMVGGVALGEWMSHGGLNSLFHGPTASNVQIGHLLRRAGFGASASDLSAYSTPGYQGAVDRLLNYQQVDD